MYACLFFLFESLLLTSHSLLLVGGTTYVEPGWYAYDTLDGDISVKLSPTGVVNMSGKAFSSYTRYYTVCDTSTRNCAATVNRTVIIGDGTPPVLYMLGE